MISRTIHLRAIALVLLTTTFAVLAADPAPAPTTATWADEFVDSIGVNVHWAYPEGPYDRHCEKLKTKLAEAGIRHLRDGAFPLCYRRCTELYNAFGIRTLFIHSARVDDGIQPHWNRPLDVSGIPALTDAIRASVPMGAICGIEGPNEFDLSHDAREKDWAGKLRDYQRELYKRVKADEVLKDVPVIGPSLTTNGAYAQMAGISDSMDFGCGHYYRMTQNPESAGWGDTFQMPPYGGGVYGSMDFNIAMVRQMCAQKPIWCTETGYMTFHTWVNETVQGKYLMRALVEHYRLGIRKSFVYELVNENDDPADGESNYGLLRNDLSEKPAFVALKNLLGLLKDNSWDAEAKRWTAAAFKPGALDFRLEGEAQNVRSVLLQKRDGDFYLLLWQAVADPKYHNEKWQPKYEKDAPVTLKVASRVRPKAVVHTLGADGTLSRAEVTVGEGGALPLTIPDRIMVVQLTPGDGM